MLKRKKTIIFLILIIALIGGYSIKKILMEKNERDYQVYNENGIKTIANKDYYLNLIPQLTDKDYIIQSFIVNNKGDKKGIQIEKKDDSNYIIFSDRKTGFLDDRFARCDNKKYILNLDIADIEVTYYLLPGVKTEYFNGESALYITYYFRIEDDIRVEGSIPSILGITENYQSFDEIPETFLNELNNKIEKLINEIF